MRSIANRANLARCRRRLYAQRHTLRGLPTLVTAERLLYHEQIVAAKLLTRAQPEPIVTAAGDSLRDLA